MNTTQASPVHSIRMMNPSVGYIDFAWMETESSMDPMLLGGVFISFRPMIMEKPYYSISIENDKHNFLLIANERRIFSREDARVLWAAAIGMDNWQVKECVH